jgi:hypothetical protein
MTEINLSEVFINAIKKGRVFEKTEKYKKVFFRFIFFTSVVNACLLATNIYNLYTMRNVKKSIKKLQNIESKIEELHKNILHLYKLSDDKLNNINKHLIDFCSCKNSTTNLICVIDNVDEINNSNNETNIETNVETNIETNIDNVSCLDKNNDDNVNNKFFDELMDECYDNIPCNNIKKYTIFNTFFKW